MKFYGQFNKYPVDKILYDRYFKDFNGQGISLECGAADGINISSTKFFEETLGWKTINVEALPESYEKLVTNRPQSININVALSDSEGEAYIRKNNRDVLFSMLSDSSENAFKVRKTTYRKIIEELSIPHLSLMVLDVEYHEKEAIDGMAGAKVLPDIFCVEFAGGDPDNNYVYNTILKMGYVFDYKFKVNKFFRKIVRV